MTTILTEVHKERQRQNDKWGVQDHNAVEWIAILTEEVGEASKEAVDFHFENGSTIDPEANHEMQQQRIKNYRKVCVQIAAVAVQMVESLDRQTKNRFLPKQ